jgi:AcrR family transcriptional regulator
LTRGGLYFHFGSKNDVLAALVERSAAVVADIEGAEQSAPEEAREALRHGINRTAKSWAERGAVMRAAVELLPCVPQIEACWQAQLRRRAVPPARRWCAPVCPTTTVPMALGPSARPWRR